MYKRQMLILYLMFCLVMLLISYSKAETIEGKVTSVIDGNTFEFKTNDKEIMTVKLWGVDSPEKGQPYSQEAYELLSDLIHKSKVSIELKGKDRKGVHLVDVYLKNGDLVNKIILEKGLGWAETIYAKGAYSSYAENAKVNRIGLWQQQNPTPPWIFRRQQSMKMAKGR